MYVGARSLDDDIYMISGLTPNLLYFFFKNQFFYKAIFDNVKFQNITIQNLASTVKPSFINTTLIGFFLPTLRKHPRSNAVT